MISDTPTLQAQAQGRRTAKTLLERWGATPEQIERILDGSPDWGGTPGPLGAPDGDALTRISLLLNIHAALRQLFENPANLYGFMAMANHNAPFDGQSPLDYLAHGGLYALHDTWRHLDTLRQTP